MSIDRDLTDNLFIWNTAHAVVDPFLVTYGDVSRANKYMDGRLRSSAWRDADVADRRAALREATEIIERLNFAGSKASDDQYLAFPRGADTEVPQDIEKACYEIALKLIEGFDPELEIDNLAAISQGYTGVRTTYERTFVHGYMRAGVPSAKAWAYLTPYLADHEAMTLRRVT